ncbi:uncharacterized protein LOC133135350 [Conger conger]|uniref:uncharacterized protein LOC133135350 n=1 Tax=Conger conger TaxID=82655 RepID=UPI002A5B0C60|nr:uncharacterized protein LOC133135350 [Conger conger]
MWREQDFIWAVIPQLKNGIEHFKTVATILLAYDESKKEVLQKVIVQAKQSLGQAESAASGQLSQVDALTQSLTVRKGELDRQQMNKVKELENLKSESQYIADCIETFSTALNNARRARDSAQGTLRHLENKQRESQAVRDAGIGIMFIPIIGTIIGAVMVGVSQQELDDAQWSLRTAEQELQKSEASAQNYYRMLEEKKRQRTQKKDEIAQCSRTIEQIKQSLAQVYTQRTNIARAQEKLRNAVNMLGTLAGRASVAKTLTQRVICLPPVVNTLGEIIELMLQMQGDRRYELLSDPKVKAVILSLQEIYKKLSAIKDLQTLNEIQFY